MVKAEAFCLIIDHSKIDIRCLIALSIFEVIPYGQTIRGVRRIISKQAGRPIR
jgi:hypothetical protein